MAGEAYFGDIDQNRDAEVSASEVVGHFGITYATTAVSKSFEAKMGEMDADGSGAISKQEFLQRKEHEWDREAEGA